MADGSNIVVDKHSCRVFGRFRPLEDGADESPWSIVDGREVEIPPQPASSSAGWTPSSTAKPLSRRSTRQQRPLVQDLLDGYNANVFAYGQTGTGKTHGIYGPVDASHEHRGLALRAIEALFRHLGGLEASIGGTSALRASPTFRRWCARPHVELHNDAFNDLLTPADVVLAELTAGMDLRLRTAPSGAYVEGLTEVEVATPAEIFELVAAGNARRVVAGTAVNAVVARPHDPLPAARAARGRRRRRAVRAHVKAVADRLGLERAAATEGLDDERAEEGRRSTCRSTSLGLCVQKLTTAAKGTAVHVPYRNSKLTQLLQDSLGGNTKTVMLFGLSRAASRSTRRSTRCDLRCAPRSCRRPRGSSTLRRSARPPPPHPSAAPSRRPSHACAQRRCRATRLLGHWIVALQRRGARGRRRRLGQHDAARAALSLSLREEQLAAREMRIAAEEATAALRVELEAEKRDGAARERTLCAALAELEAALGQSERARRKALKKLKKLEGGRRELRRRQRRQRQCCQPLSCGQRPSSLFGTPAPGLRRGDPRRRSEGRRRSKSSESKTWAS